MTTIPQYCDAVLFDFDGTLAPNLDLPDMRRQVVNYTLALGVPDTVFADRYIVEVVDAAAAWIRRKPGLPIDADQYHANAHQLILDIELGASADNDPFPGIREMLRHLSQASVKTGVVTRNCRQAVLQTFPDILEFVDILHARDDVEYLKPDQRHLLTTLSDLGCDPGRAVMVGDGALDMRVGKSIGMHCIGVLSGSSDTSTLIEAGADQILANCQDLS